jgi:hypothetical protein
MFGMLVGLAGKHIEEPCDPYCLFNLTADLGEKNNLYGQPQ